MPEGARSVEEMATFAIDYTFWLNLVSVIVVGRHVRPRATSQGAGPYWRRALSHRDHTPAARRAAVLWLSGKAFVGPEA